MPDTNIKIKMRLTSRQALEMLRKKKGNMIPTEKWDELQNEAHDKAFTVANVMSADILQEVYSYVEKAMNEGIPFEQFKKDAVNKGLIERMQKAGWTGDSKYRLRLIYETNIATARAKVAYQQQMLIKDVEPYWIYHQLERKTKNPEHAKLNGLKFRADDPIWQTIYPPSAFGCACWVESTDDPTGCVSSKGLQLNLDNFNLAPLKAWTPDVRKYNKKLQAALKTELERGKKNPHALRRT